MKHVDPDWECAAGRTAFFGGRWLLPCYEQTANHHTIVTVLMEVELCDKHLDEVNRAGLITDAYVSREGAEFLVERERRGLPRRR